MYCQVKIKKASGILNLQKWRTGETEDEDMRYLLISREGKEWIKSLSREGARKPLLKAGRSPPQVF